MMGLPFVGKGHRGGRASGVGWNMSAIASTYLIPTAIIPELRKMAGVTPKVKRGFFGGAKEVEDPFWDWFYSSTTKVSEFDQSGFIYNTLLAYLEEKKGIDLFKLELNDVSDFLTEKRPYLMILITSNDAAKLVDRLNPVDFSTDELVAYYRELNEEDPPYPPEAFNRAIGMLQESLKRVQDKHALVFHMG